MIVFGILAFFVTWLVGPFMFFLLSRKASFPRWPVGEIDGWGDILFLPVFNLLGVVFGVFSSFNRIFFLCSFLFGLVVTILFTYWRRDLAVHNDWSRPKKGVFTLGGYYHSLYMLVQAGFILYSFLLLEWFWVLFLPLAGYAIMVVLRVGFLKKSKGLL